MNIGSFPFTPIIWFILCVKTLKYYSTMGEMSLEGQNAHHERKVRWRNVCITQSSNTAFWKTFPFSGISSMAGRDKMIKTCSLGHKPWKNSALIFCHNNTFLRLPINDTQGRFFNYIKEERIITTLMKNTLEFPVSK